MKTGSVFFATLTAMLLAVVQLVSAVPNADRVTVCEVVKQPESFDKRKVRIDGVLRSDGRHFVVLLDREGDDSGLAVIIPDAIRQDPMVDKLLDLLYAHPESGLNRVLYGSFSGTFEWKSTQVPSRVLTLDHVYDVRVDP